MAELFFKRTIRYFKENILKYVALLILVIAVVVVVVAIERTAYTVLEGRENSKDIEKVEDGQFSTIVAIPEDNLKTLGENYDVEIEDISSIDIETNGFTYRVFRDRKSIDKLVLSEGNYPEKLSDIVLDQNVARDNNISLEDKIQLRDREYNVCGIGSIPDYGRPTQNRSDACVNNNSFSWVIVSEEAYDAIIDQKEEKENIEYTYAFILGESTDMRQFSKAVYQLGGSEISAIVDNLVITSVISRLFGLGNYDEIPLVLSFTQRSDNSRMDEELMYANLYKVVGYFAGAVLIVLLAFIFSVFVRNQVNNDHLIIGSLYAMGVRKRAIMLQYMVPGLAISLAGGAMGLLIGFCPFVSNIALKAFHNVLSFPYYEYAKPAPLVLYALVMPIAMYFVVSFLTLVRSLSRTALSLIRGDYTKERIATKRILSKDFIRNFQLNRLQTDRSFILIAFCTIFSITLFFMGLNINTMIKNNQDIAEEQIGYDRIFILNEANDELVTSGDKIFLKDVKAKKYDANISFLLIGIEEDSQCFDVSFANNSREVVINKALASKLKLKKGDSLELFEGINKEKHTVTVNTIVDAGSNLEMYMNIDYMRRIYGAGKSYYNAIASSGDDSIDDSVIYSSISKEEIITGYDTLLEAMKPSSKLTLVSAIIIFFMTLFLTVDTIIDSNAIGISLLKVLGFRKLEIQRMYVNNMIYEVAIALAIAIPLGKLACNSICPYILKNLPMGMFFGIPWYGYILIYVSALAMLAAVLIIQHKKIVGVDTNEVLKNRE